VRAATHGSRQVEGDGELDGAHEFGTAGAPQTRVSPWSGEGGREMRQIVWS